MCSWQLKRERLLGGGSVSDFPWGGSVSELLWGVSVSDFLLGVSVSGLVGMGRNPPSAGFS